MKWHQEDISLKLGSLRNITKFLFFPVCINETVRWLEKATIRQRCTSYHTLYDIKYVWVNEAWLDS